MNFPLHNTRLIVEKSKKMVNQPKSEWIIVEKIFFFTGFICSFAL